jgi:hypothetical protein
MDMFDIAAILGGLAFVVHALVLATGSGWRRPGLWRFPAMFCVAFLMWSFYAIATEGPTGFWPEHTRHAWGNQIWFDLLLAAGIALAFLVPQARKLGMRPLPWVILVICTGSVGLLAMTSRVLYLREANVLSEAGV